MAGFLISAAHKSSGKTTLSIGLCAALRAQGHTVQSFKKGPDFIDPMWLALASGRPCYNLDPFLSTPGQIAADFARRGQGADVCLVEGNKGLYDGLALDGSNSNAALAKGLGLPVVLVLDARGMTRGIAPLILGYQAFDRDIRIAGVILNQLGGSRHEAKLRAVIEHYTDVTVLGALALDAQLTMVERHLGLMPSNEADDAAQRVRQIGARVAAQVDVPRLLALHVQAPAWSPAGAFLNVVQAQPDQASAADVCTEHQPLAQAEPVRIGVVRDAAFGFYYPDDMDALRAAGAELVPIDALHTPTLPALDGLFIGGGFPEVAMHALQANGALRAQLRAAISAGLPTYAECGGLMYLARSLRWKDQTAQMVGALPVDVVMHERPVGRGYVRLQATPDAPWSVAPAGQDRVLGHEFHYSSLENLPPDARYAYRVLRGHGIDGANDGLVYRNVLACYAHLRSGAGSDWASGFVQFVRQKRTQDQSASPPLERTLTVAGQPVQTDSEGYLLNLDDWSEDFVRAQAKAEGLTLTPAHWEIISYLRAYFDAHRVQAQVRAMIQHFSAVWGPQLGCNHHLHTLFPRGGPQKQGNRLAGLLRTKGEH